MLMLMLMLKLKLNWSVIQVVQLINFPNNLNKSEVYFDNVAN